MTKRKKKEQLVILTKLKNGEPLIILEGTYKIGPKMAIPKKMKVHPSGEDDNFTIQAAVDIMAKKRIKIG